MEIFILKDQPTLSVRTTTSVSALPQTIGEIYQEIAGYLSELKSAPAGFPFVIYYNMDMDRLDAEIGFPAVPGSPGTGRIKASVLPGGRFLHMVHTGPYRTLDQSYQKAMAYLEQERIVVQEWMYEMYYNDPDETPEEKLLTGVFFPIAEEQQE